jgi:hypothetical protein
MLSGVEIVAKDHPELFRLVPKPIGELDAANPAISLAASTLLNAAEKVGTEIPTSVKEKFAKGSKIADAIKPRTVTRRTN